MRQHRVPACFGGMAVPGMIGPEWVNQTSNPAVATASPPTARVSLLILVISNEPAGWRAFRCRPWSA